MGMYLEAYVGSSRLKLRPADHITSAKEITCTNAKAIDVTGIVKLEHTSQEHQNLTFGQAQSVDAHLDVQHAHGSMQHPKSQEAAKVLRHEHSVEAHDRDAGRLNGAQDDEGGISHIQLAVHATQEDARQAVNGQQEENQNKSKNGDSLIVIGACY
ncbi:MAG: hypothetical protein FRX49_02042 [Trebouxia sp. A1-2]|nr:MAG: hypothetical protein FRX49_02042 [Trebouxia sp. A1-2]